MSVVKMVVALAEKKDDSKADELADPKAALLDQRETELSPRESSRRDEEVCSDWTRSWK